jgi:peptide/nickel transport system permease protein
VSSAIFTEAFLSFFGLGPQGIETWGQMVNYAYNAGAMLTGTWWWFLPPGFCITILVLGFAMLGYGIEEILNPALKRRGGALKGG